MTQLGPVAFNIQLHPTEDITGLSSLETGNLSYGSVPAQLNSRNHTTSHSETYWAPSGVFLLGRNSFPVPPTKLGRLVRAYLPHP